MILGGVISVVLVIVCCCFLETSGEDPERYVVFKCEKLNIGIKQLPTSVEHSPWLIGLVSLIEKWRNKLLCKEDLKDLSPRVSCDISGVKIEIKGIDEIEEASGL